jgi:predicted nuclease of predicted toxin-antitoxin system
MKILVDMNLSPLWVQFLSGRGYHARAGTILADR